jgi:hypothetical protein
MGLLAEASIEQEDRKENEGDGSENDKHLGFGCFLNALP